MGSFTKQCDAVRRERRRTLHHQRENVTLSFRAHLAEDRMRLTLGAQTEFAVGQRLQT